MKEKIISLIELKAVLGICIIFSCRMLGMFMVLPVLTTYSMNIVDGNKFLVGLAIGAYGLTQSIFQIPFGFLSDKMGRKPVIILGLMLFFLGSIIAAFFESIWGVIIGRLFQGCGAISATAMALLSDLTREHNRTKAMAAIGFTFAISFIISIILGPIITHFFGFYAIFWLMACLSLVSLWVICFFIPIPIYQSFNRNHNLVRNNIFTVLKNPELIGFNSIIFFLHGLLVLNFILLPDQLVLSGVIRDRHWQIYFLTIIVSFICIIPIIIYCEHKKCLKQLLMISILFLFISESLFFQAHMSFSYLLFGLQVFFLSFNLLEALLPALVSKTAPEGFKGTAMGLYSTSQFLGSAMGGILGGWISNYMKSESVFLLTSLVSVLCLFIVIFLNKKSS